MFNRGEIKLELKHTAFNSLLTREPFQMSRADFNETSSIDTT
jgi:hypothetical protein